MRVFVGDTLTLYLATNSQNLNKFLFEKQLLSHPLLEHRFHLEGIHQVCLFFRK